jgi:hypothetical protein
MAVTGFALTDRSGLIPAVQTCHPATAALGRLAGLGGEEREGFLGEYFPILLNYPRFRLAVWLLYIS